MFTVAHDRVYRAVRQVAHEIRRSHGRVDLCVEGTALISSPAIVFTGTLRARMNLQLSGSRMKLFAPYCNRLAEKYHDASPPQNWARLMQEAGVAEVAARFELPIPPAVENEVKPWLDSLGPYLVFNLDGSIAERQVALSKAREMIPAIYHALGLVIVIPYDPAGRRKAEALAAEFPYVHVYPGQPTILHSATMIKHAKMLISPNTAAIHIASAYDVPTLGLYHRLEPVWQPRASIHEVAVVKGPLGEVPLTQYLNALDKLIHKLHPLTQA